MKNENGHAFSKMKFQASSNASVGNCSNKIGFCEDANSNTISAKGCFPTMSPILGKNDKKIMEKKTQQRGKCV